MKSQEGGITPDVLSKTREIVKVLPKFNCGLCGFGNCGHYARAVAEGKASPNLCIGGYSVARRICEITGAKMPTAFPGTYPAPWAPYHKVPTRRGQELSSLQQRRRELAQQLDALKRRVDALAARIEG
jgi:Na+-translocating ferredoxin:NAD+ oxidoreductase RNF subunit RnfB